MTDADSLLAERKLLEEMIAETPDEQAFGKSEQFRNEGACK